MLRSILLVVVTLAVVLGLFGLYQFVNEPPAPLVTDSAPSTAVDSQPAASSEETAFYGNVGVKSGEKPFMVVYDPTTGQPRYQFRAQTWEPIAGSTDQFDLSSPQFQIRMPAGQLVAVVADKGRIVVRKGGHGEIEPRSGWLEGNVQITLDRTAPNRPADADSTNAASGEPEPVTGKRRDDASTAPPLEEKRRDDASTAPPVEGKRRDDASTARAVAVVEGEDSGVERKIHIRTDHLDFNIELARLETPADISLETADAMLEGSGLVLKWNELDNRLQYLEINKGKRIEFWGDANLLGIKKAQGLGSPGDSDGANSQDAADQPPEAGPERGLADRETSEPTPSRTADSQSGEPETAPAATTSQTAPAPMVIDLNSPQREQRDRIDTYVAKFTDQVLIRQLEGDAEVGRLATDQLDILFDLGSAERKRGELKSTATRPTATQPVASPAGRVELTWTGPLRVEQLESRPASDQPNRVHVTAQGGEVRLRDSRAEVLCDKLEYHAESDRTWLSRVKDAMVEVSTVDGWSLHGRDVFFDRRLGVARVDGPGRLEGKPQTDSAKPSATPAVTSPDQPRGIVSWEEQAEISLGRIEVSVEDPANPGKTISKNREYIQKARLTGKVDMRENPESKTGEAASLLAETVEVAFGDPHVDPRWMNQYERLNAQGKVALTQGKEKIACDRMEVEQTLNDAGRAVPHVANAFGKVVATQGRQRFSADQYMTAYFVTKLVGENPGTSRGGRAGVGAVDAGAVNKGAGRGVRSGRLALDRLVAIGNVRGSDPSEPMDLSADELDCTFTEQGQVAKALLTGSADRPASARQKDFFIKGPKVDLDAVRGWMHVPGAGQLDFVSDQDLDGRELKNPAPVTITWTDEMTLAGDVNKGTFTGGVRAKSENTEFNCDQLQVDFADVEPRPDARPRKPRDPLAGFHLFRPFLAPLLNTDDNGSSRLVDARVGKRPIYVMGTGNAEAKSTNTNPRTGHLDSRMYVSGPKLVVDVRTKSMMVDGKGVLLIEDYELPSPPSQAKPGSGKPAQAAPAADKSLIADMSVSGPAQTRFVWSKILVYRYEAEVVEFHGEVWMIHLSGKEMKGLDVLAKARDIPPERIKELSGRRVELTCDQLIAEFDRTSEQTRDRERGMGRINTARIKQFEAGGGVHLQEKNRSVQGMRLRYNRPSETISVYGEPRNPAQIFVGDEKTGKSTHWTGPELHWDRRTNRIDSPGGSINASN